MLDRRDFLAAAGLGMVALAGGGSRIEADSTWLTYAPDVELFWVKQRFLERLGKLSEAGFSRYEFGRWKTKDFGAIIKRNEELSLMAAIFNGAPRFHGAKWQEQLLESLEASIELAPKIGAGKITIFAPDRDEKLDRQDQVDDFVDALKEAVEKLGEAEVVLILEPVRPVANRPASLVGSIDEASAIVKAVGSARLKFALTIDPPLVADAKVADLIRTHKETAGYYRLSDFAPPANVADEGRHAQILRAIQEVGYPDPIGLGLAAKGDPMAAIESIRKLDAAAKGV